jgi:hypothetical protein
MLACSSSSLSYNEKFVRTVSLLQAAPYHIMGKFVRNVSLFQAAPYHIL